jgi:hypothetical protein
VPSFYFPLLLVLAMSLAELARHCIHAIIPSSSSSKSSGVLGFFVFLRHHLLNALSALMIFGDNTGSELPSFASV